VVKKTHYSRGGGGGVIDPFAFLEPFFSVKPIWSERPPPLSRCTRSTTSLLKSIGVSDDFYCHCIMFSRLFYSGQGASHEIYYRKIIKEENLRVRPFRVGGGGVGTFKLIFAEKH